MTSWLLLLVLLLPALWLIRLFIAARLVLGLEFRPERVVPLPVDQLPAHLVEAAAPWLTPLEGLGFRRLGGWQVVRSPDGALDDLALVMAHPIHPVRAVIRPHDSAARSGECWVELRTTTEAGLEIITRSFGPEELVPRPPGIMCEVVAPATLAEVSARHEARIALDSRGAWHCFDLSGAVQREQYVCDGIRAHLMGSGLATERENGAVSFRFGAAFRRAAEVLRQARRQKGISTSPAPAAGAPPLSPAAQLAFDYQHYRQSGAILRGRVSGRAKMFIALISLGAFAAWLAWSLSPVIAVSLLAALLVHEGGHLLGMWLFGHRDTQLLFIPFFGGAAISHDEKVLRPWQHIVIVLLGPLPGLFAGLAILAHAAGGGVAPWLVKAAVTTVALNAFNLLPILPLDGGQIVDLAIASRLPRVRVLFVAASALALLGLALLLDAGVVLAVLGVLTLLRLPIEWKLARLRRELRREYPAGGDEEPIVRRLLARLREPAWRRVAMAQRLEMARALQRGLRMPLPSLGTMCFALLGYSAPLWAGLPLAVWAAYRGGEAQLQKAEKSAAAAGLTKPAPPTPLPPMADEQNAAIPYAQAAVIAREHVRARDQEVLQLLREAARRPAFGPAPGLFRSPGRADGWQDDGLVERLPAAAVERLRYHELEEALRLSTDALRLIRLLDASPAESRWSARRRATEAAWSVIEEVSAAGGPIVAPVLTELRGLLDEPHEVAVALVTVPRELVAEAGEPADAPNGFWHRFVLAMAVAGGDGQSRADVLNDAVALQARLREISGGQWPAGTGGPAPGGRVAIALEQLGNLLGRLRQARAALAIAECRARGAAVESLERLGLTAADTQHPFSRAPLRLVRRGAIDVLEFAGASGHDDRLVWRLPGIPDPAQGAGR